MTHLAYSGHQAVTPAGAASLHLMNRDDAAIPSAEGGLA